MTEDFKKIIDEDITKCETELENGNKASRGKLHGVLLAKYGNIIEGFKDGLHSLFYDESGTYCKENLERMREMLLLFKAMEYKNCYSTKNEFSGITVNNTNSLSTTLNISFAETKAQVENMTSLRYEEIDEIQTKIDELEAIVNSNDRKTKKWDKAKEIIKWVADKGIDVGLTLLPLILKLGE